MPALPALNKILFHDSFVFLVVSIDGFGALFGLFLYSGAYSVCTSATQMSHKRDLLALNLSGTYCHKTGTNECIFLDYLIYIKKS